MNESLRSTQTSRVVCKECWDPRLDPQGVGPWGRFQRCPESTQPTQLDPASIKALEHQGSWSPEPRRCKPALSVRPLSTWASQT